MPKEIISLPTNKNSVLLKVILFLCFVALLSFCGKKQAQKEELPQGMMSEETFTRVLTDFALAESAASMNIKNTDLRKLDSIYAFDPLADNGVTRQQYDSAISFYVRRPELYKKIYENVLTALSDLQAKRNPLIKDTISK